MRLGERGRTAERERQGSPYGRMIGGVVKLRGPGRRGILAQGRKGPEGYVTRARYRCRWKSSAGWATACMGMGLSCLAAVCLRAKRQRGPWQCGPCACITGGTLETATLECCTMWVASSGEVLC